MQSVTIGSNQAGQRLDKFLHKYLPEAGSSFLYKMLRKKNIVLNGKKAEGKEILASGDEVNFFFSEETFAKFTGTSQTARAENHSESEFELAYKKLKGIDILYEDENILLLNKPAGILTQKAAANDISINEWLIGYLLTRDEKVRADFNTFHPSVCNRLDRNTSGIVLCGKSLPGSQELSRIIKERSLQKYYYTICAGEITKPQTIEGYLSKNTADNKVSIGDTGDYIKTAYRPLCAGNGYTFLEVELITGKTHQIRAHLASIHHPIIGDVKYGNVKLNKVFQEKYGLKNQLLHAHHVIFPQVDSAGSALYAVKGRTFTAPCPKQFMRVLTELGLIETN